MMLTSMMMHVAVCDDAVRVGVYEVVVESVQTVEVRVSLSLC